jgi:hypothetical protein
MWRRGRTSFHPSWAWLEAANDRALRGRTRRGLATRQYRAMSPVLDNRLDIRWRIPSVAPIGRDRLQRVDLMDSRAAGR